MGLGISENSTLRTRGSSCLRDNILLIGGPYWLEALHNHKFIERVQRRINKSDENVWTTKVRLNGLLEACLEELPDVPFYYNMQKDFGIVLKASQIKTQIFRSAVINAGYRLV